MRCHLCLLCRHSRVNIKEFISSENNKKPGCGPVELVYRFCGPTYPAVFFPFFISWLAERWGKEYISFSGETADISAFQRACYQTFLGRSFLIWGGNYASYSSSTRKTLGPLLKTYSGPHSLALFFTPKERETVRGGNGCVLIECDGAVDRELFDLLALFKPIQISNDIWDRWTKKRGTLSFDDAARLLWYARAAGDLSLDWLDAWGDRLFPADQSLFKLSQYFFARDRSQFMALWALYKDEYPAEFWVAFWSEQLWQAHMVVTNAKGGGAPSGQVTNRLPFSFLQRDWRRYELRELIAAHAALYGIDFALKNGSADLYAIELFVAKFVIGGFSHA